MNNEEVRRRLVELALTDIECDKDGHGDCSMCEYRYADGECAKYYSGVIVDFFIKNGVTIRERGEWMINCDGYYPYCPKCMREPESGKMTDFCPHCGADMRGMTEQSEAEKE